MGYFALTNTPLPDKLQGLEPEIEIRPLTDDERFAIEDFYFRQNKRVAISHATTAILVDPKKWDQDSVLADFADFIEFGFAVLTVEGFLPVTMAGIITKSKCTDSIERSIPESVLPPQFPKRLATGNTNIWFRQLFTARKAVKDRLRVTAGRFVRYSRTQSSQESLLDLCICLESLLDTTTEISFRFSTCLAKVTKASDAEELSELLTDLYDLRSKIVHGSDASKPHKKLDPHLTKLRLAARNILTTYIFFLTQNSKESWNKHLRSCLFS
jgi:hypothetical protein